MEQRGHSRATKRPNTPLKLIAGTTVSVMPPLLSFLYFFLLHVTRCIFQGNTALQKNASVVVLNSGTVEFSQCTFANNAAGGGGAIDIQQGHAFINSCTFDSNAGVNGGINISTAQTPALPLFFFSFFFLHKAT